MDARELAEWAAYFHEEPWGEERADLRSGLICAAMANAWRGKRGRAYKPGDFMPLVQAGRKARTPGEMKRFLGNYSQLIPGSLGRATACQNDGDDR